MIKKIATTLLFIILSVHTGYSQEEVNEDEYYEEVMEADVPEEQEETVIENTVESDNEYDDEIVEAVEDTQYEQDYNEDYTGEKDAEFKRQRKFKEDLYDKYGFEYKDSDLKEKEKEREKPKEQERKKQNSNSNNLKSVFSFLGNIFPYILGVVVILIILKAVMGDSEFWKFRKKDSNVKLNEKLVFDDDDDIEEANFERLIKVALENKDYRLATRYNYLLSLQKLVLKNVIKYHKDKTNTEYQFEITNTELQKKFSYISYIYNYVWYGEFPVDQIKYNNIDTNFKVFNKLI